MPVIAAFMVPHPPLIVPAVGRGGEAQIAETTKAYEEIASQIAALQPETIIISSPHAVMYADYFHISPGKEAFGSFSQFRAPSVSFHEKYDTELVKRITELAEKNSFPAGSLGERDRELDHGVMVPLYFIRKKYQEMKNTVKQDFKIVRVGLSGLPLTDHYRFGQLIREAVEKTGRRTVFVASGDLSHKLQAAGPYGFAPEGPEYDSRIMDVCSRGAFGELFDFEESFCEKAAECGHRSFVIMAGVLDGTAVRAKAYSHQDITGVGYGICSFYPEGEDEKRRFLDTYLVKLQEEIETQKDNSDEYVRLARKALESWILEKKRLPMPKDLPEEMKTKKAGTFVSIHEYGHLRGCIGTILPVESCIAQEIISNAISASTRDPRFDPITPAELKWLEISVDILGDPVPIDSPDQLDVKRYGVIVSARGKRGLLLPDLPGVDTVEQQISIARQKAGIGPEEKVSLQRFEVVRHL
ncbi:MAG: AmmeMemoRadiSam system protein A [Blautia sp.]|nr:AmmeMemoRadiSam system protein A [Blautia sp.]